MFIWDYLLKSITKCMRFSYEKNYWDFGTKELKVKKKDH